MMEIGEEAIRQLKEYRERRGPGGCVRLGILSGSTSGPMLGVTVDDKNDTDVSYSFEDLEVIIDESLMRYCESITIEYVLQEGGGCGSGGFRITPKNQL